MSNLRAFRGFVRDSGHWFIVHLLAAATAAFVSSLMLGVILEDKPSCPTEDSCAIDYHDGEWKVTETTP